LSYKTYSVNMLKEVLSALHFPSFNLRESLQKHVASMPADQALVE
jgi:hypothetical protein